MDTRIDRRTVEGSRLIHAVTRFRFAADGTTFFDPDGCWDFAILRSGGDVRILRTGLTTRSVAFMHKAGDETLAISFRPSAFMPGMPGPPMLDRAAFLERVDRRAFRLHGDAVEIPNFDNADVFAAHLERKGLIRADPLVASVIEDAPKASSERTLQRRFLSTTGMSYKHFTMIERAQKAVALLRMGRSALDVAFALGFYDQAHLINSLKAIMGRTPEQLKGREPA